MPVEIEFEGKTYTGSYTVEQGMITVSNLYGRKVTQVGSSSPASLARIMLAEIVREDPERRK
jgi:hypothetical protein